MSFQLWFMGCEQAKWAELVRDAGSPHLGVSFWGLKRRLPKTKPWLFLERFQPTDLVFLDSGGHSANKTAASVGEWEEYAEGYKRFVEANVNELHMVTEFDCLALGPKWIAEQRAWWEQAVPLEKFLPVWHAADGLQSLEQLAQEYERVGIPEDALAEHGNLAGRVNGMRQKYGTKFHAIASAKPDDLRAVHFDSAATTSWLSPMRYGETIIWDGQRLHRYPKHMKDQARRRHRQLFEREGFDLDLIAADDANELARMAIWSFLQLEEQVSKHRPGLVADKRAEMLTEDGGGDVDNTPQETRKSAEVIPAPPPTPRDPSERRLLPILNTHQTTSEYVDEDGETQTDTTSSLRLAPASQRRCDSCLVPETPVLYADMVWRPIGQAKVGDVLLGFDEVGTHKAFRPSVVEAVVWSSKPTLLLKTENAEIVTTDNHQWLTHGSGSAWTRTDQLQAGRSHLRFLGAESCEEDEDYRAGYIGGVTLGDAAFQPTPSASGQVWWRLALADEEPLTAAAAFLATFGVGVEMRRFDAGMSASSVVPLGARRVMQKLETRRQRDMLTISGLCEDRGTHSYARGFLAGFFDAEGSFDGKTVRVAQKDSSVLRRVAVYGEMLGQVWKIEEYENGHCSTARLVGGVRENLRFLQLCQPRILRKKAALWGREMRNVVADRVLSVTDAGVRPVVDIQTSTATFLAAGVATHNCYIAQSCPAMKPGSECAFDIPVELRTKDQMLAALQSVLEMQVQRVAFMRMTEELNGGYADPNLSQEMDRFYRLVEQLKKIQDDSAFFSVRVEARQGAGVLSSIFGAGAIERAAERKGLDAGETNRFVAGALEGQVVDR